MSGSGGGFITVADSNHTVLYLQPTDFGVLIDTGYSTSQNPFREQNEVYTVATQTVSQAANNSMQYGTYGRTLLPTLRAVLSLGKNIDQSNFSVFDEDELFSGAARTWSPTSTIPNGADGGFLVSLFSGNALHFAGIASGQSTSTACYVYSARTRAWTQTGSLATPRDGAGVAVLDNGQVLAAGGDYLTSAELYNPQSGAWSGEAARLDLCAALEGAALCSACVGHPR